MLSAASHNLKWYKTRHHNLFLILRYKERDVYFGSAMSRLLLYLKTDSCWHNGIFSTTDYALEVASSGSVMSYFCVQRVVSPRVFNDDFCMSLVYIRVVRSTFSFLLL